MSTLIQTTLQILYSASTRTEFVGSKTVCNMVKILTLVLHNDYLYAKVKEMFPGQDIVQTILENLTLPFLILEPCDIENFINVLQYFNCIFRNQLSSLEEKLTKKILLSEVMPAWSLKPFAAESQKDRKKAEEGKHMLSQFMFAILWACLSTIYRILLQTIEWKKQLCMLWA